MSPNVGTLDRVVRVVVAIAALALGVAIGIGSAGGIVLLVLAGVLVATSAVSFCPLYALFHVDTRAARPLPH
jgi:hypothetical protein